MSNVEIVVEDEPPDGRPLLGLYRGVPLPRRSSTYSGVLPDKISIFRGPITRLALRRPAGGRQLFIDRAGQPAGPDSGSVGTHAVFVGAQAAAAPVSPFLCRARRARLATLHPPSPAPRPQHQGSLAAGSVNVRPDYRAERQKPPAAPKVSECLQKQRAMLSAGW
ncbi:metallopeptidase family protein [Mycobacterium sp.]|uniref:metallopeptidase family protein n=1 Tax=Mycobacterium sp. TaxID=1785 RepID=UPI003F94C9DA